MFRGQFCNLAFLLQEKRLRRHDQRTGVLLAYPGECVVNFLRSPRVRTQNLYAELLSFGLDYLQILNIGRVGWIHQDSHA